MEGLTQMSVERLCPHSTEERLSIPSVYNPRKETVSKQKPAIHLQKGDVVVLTSQVSGKSREYPVSKAVLNEYGEMVATLVYDETVPDGTGKTKVVSKEAQPIVFQPREQVQVM
jgi:phosphoribosyl-dephospho-CoA transferase